MRVSHQEFESLDLEVHSFLRDVRLHDVSALDLPGGGANRTISDLRPLLLPEHLSSASPLVGVLFSLRFFLGRVLGLDREAGTSADHSYIHRLTEEQRARSLVAPGTPDGPFQLLYVFPRELLSEIRNATVHAFSCMTLQRSPTGYRFYWGIYVKPVSMLTPVYMALIEPFRRFIVYPTILQRLRASWIERYGAT
jgi:hypothetical protein